MTRILVAALAISAVCATPALAALKPGEKAPAFTTEAAMGGKALTYALADQLKKGPVVVYFFPKANTGTCDAEAHAFSESMGKFKALGASVVGVSRDGIAVLTPYSTAKCNSAFPVASDADGKVSKAYGATLPLLPISSRTTYAVAPDGTIIMEFTKMGASDEHAEKALASLEAWKAKQKG